MRDKVGKEEVTNGNKKDSETNVEVTGLIFTIELRRLLVNWIVSTVKRSQAFGLFEGLYIQQLNSIGNVFFFYFVSSNGFRKQPFIKVNDFKKSSARLSARPVRRPLFFPSVTLHRIKPFTVGATLWQRLDFGGLIVLPLARRVLFGDQKLHVITFLLGLQDLHFHLGVVQLSGDGLRTNPFVRYARWPGPAGRWDQCLFRACLRGRMDEYPRLPKKI